MRNHTRDLSIVAFIALLLAAIAVQVKKQELIGVYTRDARGSQIVADAAVHSAREVVASRERMRAERARYSR